MVATATATPTATPTTAATSAVVVAVTPIAECIDKQKNGSFVAHFGYQNDNKVNISVPLGADNAVSPSPADRGQPTTFFPGRVVNVFTATSSNGAPISWSLRGLNVQVTNTFKTCTPTDPSVECVTTDIQNIQGSVDTNALKQAANVSQLVRRIERNANGRRKFVKLARDLRAANSQLHVGQWNIIWTKFVSKSLNCAGVEGCIEVDQSNEIGTISSNSKSFLDLARKALAGLTEARGGAADPSDLRLVQSAEKLNSETLAFAAQLPRFNSACSK